MRATPLAGPAVPPDSVDLAALIPQAYEELRSVAAALLGRERVDHPLEPSALVHQALGRLMGNWPPVRGRVPLVRIAVRVMGQVLVDHARAREVRTMGRRVRLAEIAASGSAVDRVELDDALHRLAQGHERLSSLVELRFFGGLKNAEVAEVLGVSEKTIETDWTRARACLRQLLS